MPVYVSAPYSPPPPVAAPQPFRRLRHTWTGWDGSEWDLSSAASGVLLTRDGLRGLSMPPVTRRSTTAAGVAGSSWDGYRVEERPVSWPLYVWSDSGSREWLEYDAAFWATMHPERTGTWTVTEPVTGASRSMRLRYDTDNDHTFESDPSYFGWARYSLRMVAEDPFWEGFQEPQSWKNATPVNFYGGGIGTSGPPFHISSGSTLANAVITNPGDVPAWPVWRILGPSSSVTLGVDGASVTVPFAVADGDALTIVTDPHKRSARLSDGTDRLRQLGPWRPRPVPVGNPVPLSLVLVGGGSVEMHLTPKYLRAW